MSDQISSTTATYQEMTLKDQDTTGPSTTASMTALDFPKFPLLPTELRCMIWRFAMPNARILEINWVGSEYCYYERPMTYLRSENANPILLFVNHESRTEIQRKYKMIHGPRGFCLAFDPSKDIIYETKRIISGEDGNTEIPVTFPQNNWWHWSPYNVHPLSCSPKSRIRYLAIDQRRLMELLSRLQESAEKVHWDDLEEIQILAKPLEEVPKGAEMEKNLQFGKMVPENGTWEWGRAEVINGFMRILMGLHEVSGRAPVVKIVRSLDTEESPFCYRKAGDCVV